MEPIGSLSLILRRQRVGEVENTQGIGSGSRDYGGLRHSGVEIKWQSSRTWNSRLPTNISEKVPRSGSPNWRSWGADVIAPVSKSAGVRSRESQGFSCSLKAGQDWCPSSGSRAGASSHRQVTHCSVQACIVLDGVTHVGEGHLLYSVYRFMHNLIQKNPHNTLRVIFLKMSGHSWPSQVEPKSWLSQKLL